MKKKLNFSLMVLVLSVLSLSVFSAAPTNLNIEFRNGQTFLSWTEVSGAGHYNIYCRKDSPFTSSADLVGLTPRFSVIQGSAGNKLLDTYVNGTYNSTSGNEVPVFTITRNVIQELSASATGNATQVPVGTGMVVLTTQTSGNYYYAVTSVIAGTEDKSIAASNSFGPLSETVQKTVPLLIHQGTAKTSRIYLIYTDIENCNLSYANMYAWPMYVSVPDAFATSNKLRLDLRVSGYGTSFYTYGAGGGAGDIVKVSASKIPSWWMGWSRTATYDSSAYGQGYNANIPTTGPIVNFTQARIMDFLDWVLNTSDYYSGKIDTNSISVSGHSSGGGGTLLMISTYPHFFAYGNASQAPTNYLEAGSWGMSGTANSLWGASDNDNIKMEFIGYKSELIKTLYPNVTAHEYMNTTERVSKMGNIEMPFFNINHGGLDATVTWPKQGRDLYTALNDTKRAWVGSIDGYSGHTNGSVKATAYQLLTINKDESFIAASNTHGNSIVPPTMYPRQVILYYNDKIAWSTRDYTIAGHSEQIDTKTNYEIAIISVGRNDTSDITPRRLQNFETTPGEKYYARNVSSIDSNIIYQIDTITADTFGLLTFEDFYLKKGNASSGGSKLVIIPMANVGVENSNAKLNEFELNTYPNPFNPELNIQITGISSINLNSISIKVLDIQGKLIQNLSNNISKTGNLNWNAKGHQSGVYLIVAKIGKTRIVKQVTLIK